MFKKVLSQKNRLIFLSVVSIYYLIMMFIIWNVNISALGNISSDIDQISGFVFAFALLINIDKIINERRLKYIAIFVLIILLLLYNSFWIDFGARSRDAMFSFIPIFMVYVLSFGLVSKSIVKYGLNGLLGLFFVYNILGILGAILKFDTFFFGIPNVLTDNYRYSSILNNPNAWGEFALISVFIATYFLLKTSNNKLRLIYLILILTSIIALFASMSRTALLVCLVIYAGVLIYSKKLDPLFRKLLIASLIIIVVGIVGLLIFDKDFFLRFLRLSQGLTDRDVVWKHLFDQIKNNFWYGVGYGNGTMILALENTFSVTSAHNLYLGLLYEMGFVPFLVLFIWFIKKIVSCFRYLKYTNKYHLDLFMFGVFLTAFLIGQFFEFSFFKVGPMNTFIFLVFALIIENIRLVKKEGIYKTKVTHMISGLLNGGSESMLYKVLKYADYEKFEFVVISLGDHGFYGKKIEDLGVKVVALNLKSIKHLPVSVVKLVYYISKTDVLQTWLYHANLLGVIIGRLVLVDKIIWGVRQADISEKHNKKSTVLIAGICKYFSWMTDYILSCSDDATLVHEKLGYSSKKFTTIYNGFELSLFKYNPDVRGSLREELGIGEEIVFINVARYDIQKDHNTLLSALKRFKENNNIPFKIIMCGIGIEKSNEELYKKIKNANLEEETILLGVRSDVNNLMAASDYFLLSSLGEGFPNVLGEAMASNLIPIVTDVGDCSVIVGDSGVVVQKEDPIAFYNGIMRILNLSDDEKAKMRISARQRIEENFDIIQITKEYECLYM